MSVLVSLLTVVWKPYTRDRESFLKVTSNKFKKKKKSVKASLGNLWQQILQN